MEFVDVKKLSNISIDMYVRLANGKEGNVCKIISRDDDPKGIIVLTYDGDHDHIIYAQENFNEEGQIRIDIQAESQYSENKEGFLEEVMKTKVIPITIQSFLNSEGGRLYIGVQDGWTDGQKIVGLENEKKIMEEKALKKEIKENKGKGESNSFNYSFADFRDDYEMEIRDQIDKYLKTEAELHPLLHFKFPKIDESYILQINIKPSKKPVFYKNLNTNNKEIEFSIPGLGNRKIDTFAYRTGNDKSYCHTLEEFFHYYKNHRFFIDSSE